MKFKKNAKKPAMSLPVSPDIFNGLALITGAMGLACLTPVLIDLQNWRRLLPLALDFWMASGLLRLSYRSEWTAIATAAVIILVRKLVTHTLSLNRRPQRS